MCITAILIGVAVFLACCVVVRGLSNPLRRLPGPSGLPFFGQMANVDFTAFHLKLDEWRRAYGPVMRFTMMGQHVVVLSGIDAVREALVTRGSDFAGRPPAYRAQRVLYGKDIAFQNFSSTTVALKRMALKALRPYGDGMNRLEAIMTGALTELVDDVGRKDGQPFDIERETNAFVCNVMATVLYGEKLALDDPTLRRVTEMNESILAVIDPMATGRELDALPWLRHTFVSRRGVALVEKAERLRGDIIEKKLKEAQETLDPSQPRGCLDHFLLTQAQERDEMNRPVWDDEHLSALCMDFISAGMNTTNSAMAAIYLLLLRHREVQARLQREIDSVVGRARAPALSDIGAMPYAQAFILEALRYATVLPISPPKMTIANTSVGGYYIPANTRVLINNWSVHHDERAYPQPFKFSPERFLDSAGALLPHDHPARASFIAFGLGRRICIGEHLARSRLFLLVTSLLQRFALTEVEGRPAADADPRTFPMRLLLDPPKCSLRAVARY